METKETNKTGAAHSATYSIPESEQEIRSWMKRYGVGIFDYLDATAEQRSNMLSVDVSADKGRVIRVKFPRCSDACYFVPHITLLRMGDRAAVEAIANSINFCGRWQQLQAQIVLPLSPEGHPLTEAALAARKFENRLKEKIDSTASKFWVYNPELAAVYWLAIAQGIDYRLIGYKIWQFCCNGDSVKDSTLCPDIGTMLFTSFDFSEALEYLMNWTPNIPERKATRITGRIKSYTVKGYPCGKSYQQ